MSLLTDSINDSINTINKLGSLESEITKTAEKCVSAIKAGNKILFMGNGGSAADCQHFAGEIVGSFIKKRKGLPAVALTTDTSALTSLGNDFGFEHIFRRQVEALAVKGDVLIGFSTSGNSKNIIEGFRQGKKSGCTCIGMLGCDGGKIKDFTDISIIVPSNNTQRIQESHLVIYHVICDLIDREFGE